VTPPSVPSQRRGPAGAASGASPPAPARAWHGGLLLAAAAAAGVLLAFLGEAPPRALLALAVTAVPGAVGFLRPPRERRGVGVRLWLGAAAFGIALALTGGIGGPLSPLVLLPILMAAAYGGFWREAAAPAFTALAAVAVVQAGGGLPPPPPGAAGFLLALLAAVIVLAGGAAAVLLLAGGRTPPAPAPAEPDEAMLRRLEAAEAARADAEADARGKMRFLANVSHELRTPLNAIMGFSDIMRSRLFGELQPRYAEYAELIHESGGHLLDLINDVLDVSKIDADRYQLAREAFDAREAVTAALRILRQQADDAGVQLRGVLPPEPVEVDADRRALKQMVLNLAGNALKFTPRSGSISVGLAEAAGALELVVADTGVGIAPEDLQRLGRPYEQAGDASDRARGTGLGLSLVKAFARLHGGEMLLESRLGEGTAVTVRLPVLLAPEPTLSAPAPARDA
jgi:signal transduction histidine kinase